MSHGMGESDPSIVESPLEESDPEGGPNKKRQLVSFGDELEELIEVARGMMHLPLSLEEDDEESSRPSSRDGPEETDSEGERPPSRNTNKAKEEGDIQRHPQSRKF